MASGCVVEASLGGVSLGGVSWEEGMWTCVKFEWCVCEGWSGRWSYLSGGSRMDPCPGERVGQYVVAFSRSRMHVV